MKDIYDLYSEILKQKPETVKIKEPIFDEKSNKWLLPGWLFNQSEDIYYDFRSNKLKINEKKISSQVLYDILILKISSPELRPVCPYCGNKVNYRNFKLGYSKTCGSSECISKIVTNIWESPEYREKQTISHIEWASKEENKEFLRERTLNTWKKPGYREKQSKSHKDWAVKEENKEILRNRTLNIWKNPEYRKKQTESHKLYAFNNPGKSISGHSGYAMSNKSSSDLIRFDSNWERDVIENSNNIDEILYIDRANISIKYLFEGGQFIYLPDFIIKTTKDTLLVEVKSEHFLKLDAKTEFKISAGIDFVKNSSDFTDYVLLLGKDLYFDNTYKNFNLENFKKLLKI